jgi:hypothetical protein
MRSVRENTQALGILLAGREILIRTIFPEPLDDITHVQKDGISALQPDQVRKLGPLYRPDSREMRCGEDIPPYSTVTTRGIEIFAQSFYKNHEDGHSMFM